MADPIVITALGTAVAAVVVAGGTAGGVLFYYVITGRAQAAAIRQNTADAAQARADAAAAKSRADAAHVTADDAKKSATAAGLVAAENAGAVIAAARESGSHADDIRAVTAKIADLAALIPAPGQSAGPLPLRPTPPPSSPATSATPAVGTR